MGKTAAEVWRRGVTLYGFCGEPVVVHSLAELEKLFKERSHTIACYVYVYTWVPILPHAPHVPFAIVATDNTFDGKWVWQQWRRLHQLTSDLGPDPTACEEGELLCDRQDEDNEEPLQAAMQATAKDRKMTPPPADIGDLPQASAPAPQPTASRAVGSPAAAEIGTARRRLKLIGHVSDGDARVRLCDFLMNMAGNSGDWVASAKQLPGWMLDLFHIPTTVEGHSVLAYQDWMHLLWRWRRQLLDPATIWHLGPGLVATPAHLSDVPHLNSKDLDYHEKQHWEGVEKLFSPETVAFLRMRIQEHGEDERRGTLAVVHIGMTLRDTWLAEEQPGWTPDQSIQKAAEVLSFVMFWRHHVATTSGLTLMPKQGRWSTREPSRCTARGQLTAEEAAKAASAAEAARVQRSSRAAARAAAREKK